MQFEVGRSGNPGGRPKGSYGGRIMALASLDRLLARKKNQKALMSALEKDLQGNPVRFFKTVIMPLLPREAKLSFDHEGVIQWRSLLGSSDATVESPSSALEATAGKGGWKVEGAAGRDAHALPCAIVEEGEDGARGAPSTGREG